MTDFVIPPLAGQADILHAFIKRMSFSLDDALTVVTALKDVREPELPAALRRELAAHRVKLGHMPALQVVAQLRGRRGLHDRQAVPAFVLRNSPTGEAGEKRVFTRFDDAAKAMVEFFGQEGAAQDRPFSVRLGVNDWSVMCSLGGGQAGKPIGWLRLADEAGRDEWQAGIPTFLEALRRAVEESGAPGVLDGYHCARFGFQGQKSHGELEVWDGGLRVATGYELAAYTAFLSQWTPEQLEQAVAEDDVVQVSDWKLVLKFVLRETEPINFQERSSTTLETSSLLNRVKRFAQRPVMHSLLMSAYEACVPANATVPMEVSIHQEVLSQLLEERGLTRQEVATSLGLREMDLGGKLPLPLFAHIAKMFGISDLNRLIGPIPHEDWVDVGSAKLLQGLLDVTHELRFVISDKFSATEHELAQEAASNLSASRQLVHMKPANRDVEMDYAMNSVDAGEFMGDLSGLNCLVRAGIKPYFTQVPGQELRAVGCRLVIAILPSEQAPAG